MAGNVGNPYHDDLGRFSSGPGGGATGAKQATPPDEKVRAILQRATAGSGLVSAKLSPEDRTRLQGWLEKQPTSDQPTYRGIWLSASQMENKVTDWRDGKDENVRALQSTTGDRTRVGAYGGGGDYFVIYELPPGTTVDISKWSKYPFEQEHLIVHDEAFKVAEFHHQSGGYWVTKLQQKDTAEANFRRQVKLW